MGRHKAVVIVELRRERARQNAVGDGDDILEVALDTLHSSDGLPALVLRQGALLQLKAEARDTLNAPQGGGVDALDEEGSARGGDNLQVGIHSTIEVAGHTLQTVEDG